MQFIITGSAGFIGSHLCEKLLIDQHEVIGIDCFRNDLYSEKVKKTRQEYLSRKYNGFKSIAKDVLTININKILSRDAYFVHLAALPGQALSWERFEDYVSCNMVTTQKIVESLSHQNIKKFIFVSTSSVYGEYANLGEDSTLNPISPYGITKLAAEKIVSAYSKKLNFDYTILRLFSVYGPGQRNDMLISKILESLKSDKEFKLFGDGTKVRDFTFVDDIVDGIKSASLNSLSGSIYNLSGGSPATINEIISICERVSGKKLNLTRNDDVFGDQMSTIGVLERAKADLDYSPKTTLLDGIESQWKSIF